jgi:microcystin-dependent protein
MSDQFIGEIRMVGFNFAPYGWALCNGQTLAISQNTALFSLLGTYYGGDGVTTFQLPNLQSRVPLHQGQGVGLSPYVVGQNGGFESITLTSQQMPQHNHTVATATTSSSNKPANNYWADAAGGNMYSAGPATGTLNGQAMSYQGNGLPHSNLQPYLAVSFIIATQGIFPPRN